VSPTGSGTPVQVKVTVIVAAPQISVTPTTLAFTQVEGKVAQAKSVMLGATPQVSNWSASASVANSTIPWLSASPGSGGFPGTTSIYPNAQAANLTAAGSPYQGTVTFSDSNGTPTALTAQVTLTVTAPPGPNLTLSQQFIFAETTAAGTAPVTAAVGAPPVTVLVGNSGSGNLPWTATLTNGPTTPACPWLGLLETSGFASLHAPSSLPVAFATNLTPNVYNCSIIVRPAHNRWRLPLHTP
jgi:hypothetical protein